MIENMDMVLIHGKMEDNMSVNGKMVNSMEMAVTDKLTAKKEKEFGRMEKE